MRSYWDEDLAILSAENVSFSIETAGLGSRFAALALDTFYQVLVTILLWLMALGVELYVYSFSEMPEWFRSCVFAFYTLVMFLLYFGYYFIFEWLWDGQTPGKRYFGLRVMMANGLPLTQWSAIARNAIRLVDFMPLCYGFGAVVAISNRLNQRMGDLVAGTIVVRESKLEKERKPMNINEAVEAFLNAATTVPGQRVESKAFEEDEELRVEMAPALNAESVALSHQLSREDYELVRDFLVRRETLPTQARERLGRALATRLGAKLNREVPLDFEPFLEEILSGLREIYA